MAPPVPPVATLGDMRADADAVQAALDEEEGPVVLVGHSYGGMVITDAAAGRGEVRHLVYVTSVMPDLDETMADFGGEPGPWMDPRPEEGTMGIRTELTPAAFIQDCDGETVAGALQRLTRQPLAVFGQAPRGVAGEAVDLCGLRRGPGDIAGGAAGVREEGKQGDRRAGRPPPDAFQARAPGAGNLRGRR